MYPLLSVAGLDSTIEPHDTVTVFNIQLHIVIQHLKFLLKVIVQGDHFQVPQVRSQNWPKLNENALADVSAISRNESPSDVSNNDMLNLKFNIYFREIGQF